MILQNPGPDPTMQEAAGTAALRQIEVVPVER